MNEDTAKRYTEEFVAELYVGTSGFAYPSWKPAFYPADLPEKKFLSHYAGELNSVEINYTYHRLPSAATLENWVLSTPAGFRFTLKAHMRITHILRLKNAAEFTEVFFRAIDSLRATHRLGPVLFQLPPNLKCDAALLADFLALLPADIRHAFEFRHQSWLTDEVYALLQQHRVALCLAESDRLETPPVITADFVYARLRKPDYPPEERREIGHRVADLLSTGRDVYVYFKHEESPAGALYAKELLAGSKGTAA